MKYLSPQVLLASGVIAVSFLFLASVQSTLASFFWAAVAIGVGMLALYFAPRLDDITSHHLMIHVPVFMTLVGFLLLYVLVEQRGGRLVIGSLAVFVFFVLLNTLYSSDVPAQFRARRLIPIVRMALYGGLFSFFAGSFGIMIFLKLPIALFVVPVAAAGGLASWSLLHLAGIRENVATPSAVVLGLLTFQLFWVTNFLPMGYAVAGWMLTAALYSLVQAIAYFYHHTDRLKQRSRNRMSFALLSAALVAILSRWV